MSNKSENNLKRLGETVLQAAKDLMIDNGTQWAAAISYYTILSIFPLILAMASIASFFVDPDWVIHQVTILLGELVPEGEFEIGEVIQGAIDARGTVSILSIGALLWSGSRVFGTITRALNIAFDVDEKYGFFKRTFIELVMLLTVGLLFIVAVVSRHVFQFVGNQNNLFAGLQGFAFVRTIPIVSAVLMLLAFLLIYRFVPRTEVDWRAALPGAVVATALVLIGQPLFAFYLNSFAEYNVIYGSLAIVVILIIWAWIVALILLFGGELVSHIQLMLIQGKTKEEIEARHKRRSPSNG